MEFDWSNYASATVESNTVAESFEDPFSLRVIPDEGALEAQSRFFCLGKSLGGVGIFSVYSSNGKQIRVVTSRPMTEDELFFYERKMRESL